MYREERGFDQTENMKNDLEIVIISITIVTLLLSEVANVALFIALRYLNVKSMQVSFIKRLSICYMLYGTMFGLVFIVSIADGGQFFATETINCTLQGIFFDTLDVFIAFQMLLLTTERYYMIKMDDVPAILKKHSGVIQGLIVIYSMTYAFSLGFHPNSYKYIMSLYRCAWSIQGVPMAIYLGSGIIPSVLSLFVALLIISVPCRKSNSVLPQARYQISIVEEERRNGNGVHGYNSRLVHEKLKRSVSAAVFSIPIALLLIGQFLINSLVRRHLSFVFCQVCNFLIPTLCLAHPCILLLRNKKMFNLMKKLFCCELVALQEKRRSFQIILQHPLEAREWNHSLAMGKIDLQAEVTTRSSSSRKKSKLRISDGSNSSSLIQRVQNGERSDRDSKKSKSSSFSTKITTHAEVHNGSSIVHLSRTSNSPSVCTKVEALHHNQGASRNHSLQSSQSSVSSQISIRSGTCKIPVKHFSSVYPPISSSEYRCRTSDSIASSHSSVTAKITIEKRLSVLHISSESDSPDMTARFEFDSSSNDSLAVNIVDAISSSPSVSSTFDCVHFRRYSQSI